MAKKATPRSATVAFPSEPADGGNTRLYVLVLAALLAYAAVTASLWRVSRRGAEAFVVVPNAISDAQAPEWLTAADVARINALGNGVRGRSILDPDLARDLAACYMESDWVSRVIHVRRAHPNRLDVELAIRRPFAAVERSSGPPAVLDASGVRLPASASAEGLPVLRGVSSPPSEPGRMWEDVRVLDGVRVLARYQTLVSERPELKKFAPLAVDVKEWSRVDGRPVVRIETGGPDIIWGVDLPRNGGVIGPPAEDKLARLAEQLPKIAASERPVAYIDVRHRPGAVAGFQDDEAAGR